MAMFAPATRRKLKLRLAICAPAGYGKSLTAIKFAGALASAFGNGKPLKIAAIDTEHGALSKYAGIINGVHFDVCELQHFAPSAYTAAIREAAAAGYGVLIIDSLSHAWSGVGGALAQVDQKSAAGGNSFTAWKDVTPQHNELVEAILSYPGHVIATMRTKMEYVLEETTNSKGKTVMAPKKIGMKPVQREGMDYEFDIVCDMDETHTLIVGKTRCPAIDGQRVVKPGPEFLTPVIRWLDEGVDAPAETKPVFVPDVIVTASDVQVSEIRVACQTLELADQPGAMLAKRGVSRLEDLTHTQADEILATLRKKIQARKVELDAKLAEAEKAEAAASKNPTSAATGDHAAPAATVGATDAQRVKESHSENPTAATSTPTGNGSEKSASESSGPATGPATTTVGVESHPAPEFPDRVGSIHDDDAKRIAAYCHKLQISDSDLARILAKRMTNGNPPCPVRSVPDLSHSQAQEMIANLRAALQKRFPDTQPF